MTGGAVPYHLRPHKAVDRRLFLDLLSRYERWLPLHDYAYVSMGAYALEDLKLVHRLIGIKRLISFDADETVVARQRFNRPVEECKCIAKTSAELVAQLDNVLEEAGVPAKSGRIVWLDYTEPAKIGEQVAEFQSLLDRLQPGDLVRVTVNAQPNAVTGAPEIERHQRIDDRQAKQFERLKGKLGDYLPTWSGPKSMTTEDLPKALATAFGSAALKALPIVGGIVFSPLSIVRYADGQQMLSITGALVKRSEQSAMLARIGVGQLPFATTDWSTIHHLVVPHLTLRERLFLERGIMSKSEDELVSELGFDAAGQIKVVDFLKIYKAYYRFYPTLLNADV